MRAILEVASDLGIPPDKLVAYGRWKAKVDLSVLREVSGKPRAKVILVTAMTPTPHGEGKTVTSIGLSMALHRLGHRSVVCLRQPSLGPVFGVKGGAAGGGKSTVEPMQDVNMRFTGDIDAVGAAHNLLAAVLDNHISHGNELGFDPRRVMLQRVMDMNDRSLRHITIGLGGVMNGVPRETGFEITAASEVMAVLSFAETYSELKERLARIILGYTHDGKVIRAGRLNAQGAMAAVLKEAMEPNLVQTTEGTPALVHGGCFGNIAHGTTTNSSILLGRGLADYCIVEAGFGTDLGAEKFVNIAARVGGFDVDAAALVASMKAIKYHSGLTEEAPVRNGHEISAGLENLSKHVENMRTLGLTPVVALNRFQNDTNKEIQMVEDLCQTLEVPFAISTAFRDGSTGATVLAERVVEAAERGERAIPVYPLGESVEAKLDRIVDKFYGGDGVILSVDARHDLKHIDELVAVKEPVCVAKTPLSLSDDESKLGRPHGFMVSVRNVEPAAGAGFNIVYMGNILTMPGLPKHPAAEKIDLDDNGVITGVQ